MKTANKLENVQYGMEIIFKPFISFVFICISFLFIYSQPKAEALLAEVLIVKNDIAYGKNY